MSIDRISNMIISLKNASMTDKPFVETFYSIQLEQIAQVLKKKGFLKEVKIFKPSGRSYKMLHLELSDETGSKIVDARRVSKPGRRIYRNSKALHRVEGGYGVQIVTTSKGIMDSVEAKKRNLGGEVLCEVL